MRMKILDKGSWSKEEVDTPIFGDLDVMGSLPVHEELGKEITLGFTLYSAYNWRQVQDNYSD